MNADQHRKYFKEWSALTRYCKAQQLPIPDRHEFHARLGLPESHMDFSENDFTQWLGAVWAIRQPEKLKPQLRQINMPTTNIRHRIMIEQIKLLSVVLSKDRTSKAEPLRSSEFGVGCSMFKASEVVRDVEAAQNYFETVLERRFKTKDITQLSDRPYPRGERGEEFSDLELLRDTLDARIGELRNGRVAESAGMKLEAFKRMTVSFQRDVSLHSGWNWHDLKTAAGVPCDCAGCRKGGQNSHNSHDSRKEAVAA